MEAKPPLSAFAFCPHCGKQGFATAQTFRFHCEGCGFKFYVNGVAAVVLLVVSPDNRLLVTQRARAPQAGTLDLPGGFVDPNESLEEAARRELKEELNLTATLLTYLVSVPNQYPYGGLVYYPVDIAFLCRVENLDSIAVADDVAAYQWVDIEALDLSLFGFESTRTILKFFQSKQGVKI